ncbi:PD-(D/E)XK nuclease family protein [Kangiella shandongensis]|uniref:PD-(D/E)XK nuclease family protein n=1 Tax=Kangiella shandongensis TaxID=2763258 RepID=UPI001CBBC83A|nr:PD-(D/E)XK nuclease family protein [Kangiella shandongensis]
MESSYQLEAIDPETSVVITGSQRLSRHIREEFNQHQARQGNRVWSSLNVMPWTAWNSLLWSLLAERWPAESEPLPYILSEQQSSYLWQDIVEESSWNNFLLQIPATAKKAWQAWQQYQQWQLDITSAAVWDKDQQAFSEWSQSFASRLQENHWLDSASSMNWLAEHFSLLQGMLPQHIYLAGFEQVTPQQQQLFERMSEHCELQWLQRNTNRTKPQVLRFNSRREEFRQAILSAKQSIEANYPDNPGYKFAIVVPELEKHKPLLERLLWQELTPCFQVDDIPTQGIYDFSLGEPLSKQPLVQTALNLLSFINGSVEQGVFRQLLMSPYWGKSGETVRLRAALERDIRAQHKERFSIEDFAQRDDNGRLSELVESLRTGREHISSQKMIGDWMQLLPTLLQTLQWPGYRSLSSREYQIQQTFLDCFNGLRSHQLFHKAEINFSQLLELLQLVVADKQFHQEQPKAPIQIMGMLETLGLEFDRAWLTGATYQVLPAKPNPNPFIDKQLLKQHQMPGSSSQRELDYAQQLLDSLLSSSPQVTLSYPLFEGDSELMPSPLLMSYQHQEVESNASLAPTFIQQVQFPAVESYQDDAGLPLTDRTIKGGTGFFKDQINCPFKAYLGYRLKTKAFEEAEQGLNAMERGQIVHKVLERFWKQQGSSEAVHKREAHELQSMIQPILEQVLVEFKDDFYYLQIESFFNNEKERLLTQLTQALVIDSKRLPFTPLHHEQRQTIEVAELVFNLQVDRIDQVEDGFLIIDYKTGNPTRQSLLSEPPEEPQLALYAINQHDNPVAGVSFFNINAKDVRYQGLADTIENLALSKRSAIKTPMSELIDSWRVQLEQVGQEIKQGQAIVNPRSCDYCDFSAACRINQRHKEVIETNEQGERHDS